MKIKLQKILIAIILIIVFFEFVFAETFKSNISYATTQSSSDDSALDVINLSTNFVGGIVSIIYWPKRLVLMGLFYGIDKILYNVAKDGDPNLNGGVDLSSITPFQIFFNKYKILDVNVLDLSSVNGDSFIHDIRGNVSTWFHVLRLISSIILLGILVYVGIRMAISTIASEKAMYKKMLIDWSLSVFLIFALPYICIFIININDIIVKALETMSKDLVSLNDIKDIYNRIAFLATLGVGIQSITATLVYCVMVFMTIGFFVAYVNRMIKVAFLVIISPLISITYSLDKMKDQKAQALEKWMKEFIYTVLIQPFHCIMYLAFTNTAYSLLLPFLAEGDGHLEGIGDFFSSAANAWGKFGNTIVASKDYNLLATSVLVIISLLFIKKAEEVVRSIFGFSDTNKSTSFGAGLALSLMAVNQAKNIGLATRKGVNTVKNTAAKIRKGVPAEFNKIGDIMNDTAVGHAVIEGANKAGKAISESVPGRVVGFVGGTAGRTISGVYRGGKKFVYKATNFKPLSKLPGFVPNAIRNYKPVDIANVLGSMYGISQLVAGNNILEVYADSKAVEEGMNAFLGNGENELTKNAEDAINKIDEKEFNQMKTSYNSLANNPTKDPFDEALEKVTQINPMIRSFDEFKSKAKVDYERYQKSYSDRLEENRAEAKRLRKEGIKKLKDNGIDPRSGATNDEINQARALEKEAKELESFVKAEELMHQRDEIEHYWDKENVIKRLLDKSVPPSSSDFKKARNELKKEILRLIGERKVDDIDDGLVGLGDSNTVELIEADLEDIIEKSVRTGKNVNMSKIIEKTLGVSATSDPQKFSTIKAKTDALNDLYLQKVAAEPFELLESVNGDNGTYSQERFANNFADLLGDKISRRKKK